MKIKVLTVSALAASISVSGLFLAAESRGEEPIDAVDQYSDSLLDSSFEVDANVEAQISEFLDGPAGKKFDKAGNWIGHGVERVAVGTGHKDWAKHRVLTYRLAWAKIQQAFIRYQHNEISTETVASLYQDASGEIPDYVRDEYTGNQAIDEFIDKSGAYVGKKLDSALENVGIDPEEYSRGSKTQRTQLLSSAIKQEAVFRSIGKLRGLFPLMTFTNTVGDQHSVGVVGVYRPAFEEVSAQIASQRSLNASSKSGPPISERISDDTGVLASTFGVRLTRDEFGFPILISYGQWSANSSSNNPAIRARYLDAAFKQARNQADAEIARFLTGTANFKSKSVVGSAIEEYVDVDAGSYYELGNSTSIEDLIDEVLTTRANVRIAGLNDYRKWTYKHPDGHNIVGVVRVWTPQDAEAASLIRSGPNLTSGRIDDGRASSSPDSGSESEVRRSSKSQLDVDPDDF